MSTVDADTSFVDPLVGPERVDLPDGFFDRLMFNMHPADRTAPSLITGLGIYPPKNSIDGFVVISNAGEQRNLRFASELDATDRRSCGPFSVDCIEPNKQWRLVLGPNDIGVEFDVTWRARTPAWFGEIAVENKATATRTSFDHLFQSGRYSGTVSTDGNEVSADGWFGQRDRSRGVRTMAGGQGLHIWYQAQFATFSIGFLLVETRDGQRILLEGAVMHEDGTLDAVTNVRHALQFTLGLDLVGGDVDVTTAAGNRYRVHADATAGGGFMAGAGYGGHHGVARGIDHIESDRYTLNGTVGPTTLDSSLTDRLCSFSLDGESGVGIFEFALSRSRSYTYRPSLHV
ncbi:hypothetical protein DK926_22385 [Rhodococcus sp. Eu-32]|uniref:DUF7064 domain-containing protein n=1 Tax=Rhodococcus sp. Eu-32 TaxID=1017319 RepID=UPI000DF214D2|nr:hypothetical protein [Rhodococcus sp. Eu-32]RRQ25670.1 hypothetical protein DK926_22385 [Rhodococcus sp. Eu-32]